MKKYLFTLIGFAFACSNMQAQSYSLEFNEPEYLSIPDPPYDGIIHGASWNVDNPNLSFESRDEYGAIIYPNHYFDGTAVVTCNYSYQYYYRDDPLVGTGIKTYRITFKSNHATLSKEELTLNVGKTEKLTYTLERSYNTSNYGKPNMTWKSGNDDVATVDNNGKVTAISPGRALITFDPVVGPPVFCNVTVVSNPPSKIELPTTATTRVGESIKLTPTLTPSDAYATFSWESSNENVASVSSGRVTGKDTGKTTITATTDNGLSAQCEVFVGKGSVTISTDAESGIYASGKSITLKASRSDADIYYTLDGRTPTTSSTRYTAPITLNQSVTLKAIATGSNYETSDVLTRQYQITSLAIKSYWNETEEQTPFFIPAVTFSKAVSKSICIGGVTLKKGSATIAGQPIVQDGKLYFVPNSRLDAGTYILTIPENAVMNANSEPNLLAQKKLLIGTGFDPMPKQVIGSSTHLLIIKEDGSLWACGNNDYGQLGDGTTSSPKTLVKIIDNVASASAGTSYSLFVKTDGSLWGCGANSSGQLGDGTTINRTTPVKIMDGVASVSAGTHHSLIVKTDGSLWACGANGSGQLGDGTTTNHTTPVKIMDDVASVSAGQHSLIVKTDRSLWACGINNYGQLGNSTTTDRKTPVKVMDDVASASAGWLHSLIVKTDGSLWTCGWNDQGQLGSGTHYSRSTPGKIMDEVVSASAHWRHSLIIKNDGSLWGCGTDSRGELGQGTTKSRRMSPVIIMDNVASASASSSESDIIKGDGSLWACGSHNGPLLCTQNNDDETDYTTPVCIIPVSPFSHVTSISLPQNTRQIALGSQYMLQPIMMPENSCCETMEFKSSNPQVVTISSRGLVEATAKGKATITITVDGKYIATCEVEVLNRNYEVIMSPTGYATFYDSQSAYTLPSGFSAQVVSGVSNSKISYQKLPSNVIPKNVAVMLKSDIQQAGIYTLTASESTSTYTGTNLLHGSDNATMTTGEGYHYKLSYGQTGTDWNDVFGWYWGAQDGAPFQIEGHKAWLVVPANAGTRASGYMIDGDATEIIDIESGNKTNDIYYDMQGRRISTPTRSGLYIMNGKKVIIK